MLKYFLILSICFYSVISAIAQDNPVRSINELNILLQKTRADTNRVSLLLEAGLSYMPVPGGTKTNLDSALFYVNSAMNLVYSLHEPVWEARCFYTCSMLYRQKGEAATGKNYIQQAITRFIKYNLKSDLAGAYHEFGRYYNAFSDSESVIEIKYYQQAEQLYRQTGEKIKQAHILKDLADFHQINDQDSLALAELQQALAIYQSVNYPELQGVYDLLGYILYNDGDYKQALKYGLLAVQTAEKVRTQEKELSTIYNRVGLTYYKLLQYGDAATWFNKSVSIAISIHDTTAVFIISPNVVNAYLHLEKPGEILSYLKSVRDIYTSTTINHRIQFISGYVRSYLLLNQPENAAPYVRQLINMAANNMDKINPLSFYKAVIPYYLASGQYKEMYKYLGDNEKVCRKNNIIAELTDNYMWWFKADSALRNYPDAIAHYKLYKQASDSSLYMANNKQIAQLLVQYESDKKDQAIALKVKNIELLTNQSGLQAAQLKQTRLMKNLTIGGLALLLIIIGLLFNRYRLKQRSNKKLQSQQLEINEKNNSLQRVIDQKEKLLEEKEWLLKEIHHRVKNNMQIVMSLLNTQSVYLADDALMAIKDSQHRMQAMALIHQKLYQAENVAFIGMPVYITELTDYLAESYDTGHSIHFDLKIGEIELDVAQAVPVGLILNEAITNAIKYAFPNTNKGTITIVMQSVSGNQLLLGISDNGIGLPPDYDSSKSNSLGMNLMRGLVKQLEGTIDIKSDKGLSITIEFPYNKIMKPVSENGSLYNTIETSV